MSLSTLGNSLSNVRISSAYYYKGPGSRPKGNLFPRTSLSASEIEAKSKELDAKIDELKFNADNLGNFAIPGLEEVWFSMNGDGGPACFQTESNLCAASALEKSPCKFEGSGTELAVKQAQCYCDFLAGEDVAKIMTTCAKEVCKEKSDLEAAEKIIAKVGKVGRETCPNMVEETKAAAKQLKELETEIEALQKELGKDYIPGPVPATNDTITPGSGTKKPTQGEDKTELTKNPNEIAPENGAASIGVKGALLLAFSALPILAGLL